MDTYSSNTSLNDLPNELLVYIFQYIKVRDLIHCSLVCKRFKQICGDVKIPELIIQTKIENKNGRWFYTNKQFNHQDAINVATFCTYRSILRFNKLKRLHFKGSNTEFDQLNVNDTTDLEQMKIDLRHPDGHNDKCTVYIDHTNLRIIEVCVTFYDVIHITAPKLEKIKSDSFDDILLTDPHTIKHLEAPYSDYIEVMKYVQFYQVEAIDLPDRLDFLSVFPNLKVLSIYTSNGDIGMYVLYSLVEQKFSLQRHDLKIYLDFVELDSTSKIDEFGAHYDALAFQIENYSSLCAVSDIAIDYNKLMDLVGGEIPDDFHKKFLYVRDIKVTDKVENKVHLFRFIEGFKFLTRLDLDGDSLNQSFYDDLGQLEQLTNLTIKNCSQSISNYDFLFKLKLLKHFRTDSDSTNFFDLTVALFSRLKYFEYITFFAKEEICIAKFQSEFHLSCYCGEHFDLTVDFAELPRVFEEYIDQSAKK